MTYKEQLEAEKLEIAKITTKMMQLIDPTVPDWDDMPSLHQEAVLPTFESLAAYVLKAKAEAYTQGWKQGSFDEAFGGSLQLIDHVNTLGLIPTELKAEGQDGK